MTARTHRIATLLVAAIAAFTMACEKKSASASDRNRPVTSPTNSADNTGRNKADQSAQTKTPPDQSNTSENTRITADIRRAITNDSGLSTNAHNCKIVTDASGIVTLRGPVVSQSEKDSIETKAKAVAGVTRVVNELEVSK